MIEIRWNSSKWKSLKYNLKKWFSTKCNLAHQKSTDVFNWNLMRCLFNQHKYSEPIKHLTLHRLIRRCPHCGKEIKSPYDYNFVGLQEKKFHITNHLNNDSFVEAKLLLDDLFRDFKEDKRV